MRRRMILFGVLAAVLGALMASPVLAGSKLSGFHTTAVVHKVDGSIQVVKSAFWIPWLNGNPGDPGAGGWLPVSPPTGTAGVGIYNATGNHQIANGWTVYYDNEYGIAAEKNTFKIAIRNAGNQGDRFTVKTSGTGLTGWTLSFFRGSTNITSAVKAGTYKTPLVAAGGVFAITVRLSGDSSVLKPDGLRLVTLKSVADPSKVDAVALGLKMYPYCIC